MAKLWFLKAGVIFGALLVTQCGPQKVSERKVLVATDIEPEKPVVEKDTSGDSSETSSRPPADLLELVQKDELRSSDIIRDSLKKQGNSTLSAWAAIFALHLGIKHDELLSKKAIERVAELDDPLLVALCWRWLAEKKDFRVPSIPNIKGKDPVVHAMTALAVASRRELKKDLNKALGLPNIDLPDGDPDRREESKDRVERLLFLTAPFDDGPLALAVAFVEARRKEWTEKGDDGKPQWVAKRLRSELAKVLIGDDVKTLGRIEKSKPSQGDFTHIGEKLEISLLNQTRDMLHSIAVTGEPDLQVEALTAISVLAWEPTAADFGAAAAALDSKEPTVRLAGAHTFLFLSRRARRAQ